MPEDSEPRLQEAAKRADRPRFLTRTRFDQFKIPPEALRGLEDAGFGYCTPIQSQVLPLSLSGRDVAGQAQTGTGKTAAFLVTIFTRLLSEEQRPKGTPSALIVAPTRELALQIYEDAALLGAHTGLSLAQVVGGIDYRKQADILRQGPDIVICTPGRIIDYLKQGIFKPSAIRMLVIDEADRLFDLGFTRDMRYILRRLPHYEKRQSMLFSATLSYRVLELTYEYMNLPEVISVTPEEVVVEGIEQKLFHVGSDEKLSLLLGLLQREQWERILLFANTKATVEWLTEKLKGNDYPAEGITGDLPQPKRLALMNRFKAGKVKILAATDVASRGIHVEDISHVINYDLPQDSENYIHRIGRTARAGKKGCALTFACERYVYHLEPLEKMLGYKIPVVWPEEDWFVSDRAGSVKRRGSKGRGAPPRPRRPKRGQAGGDAGRKSRQPRAEDKDKRGAGDRRAGEEAQEGQTAAAAGPSEAGQAAPKQEKNGRDKEADKPKRPKKEGRPRGSGKKVVTSSQPGGIFGLAPRSKSSEETKPKRKRRSKKKKTQQTDTQGA